MRRYVWFLMAWTLGGLGSGYAQDAPETRSGFAIVTLLSGNIGGLVATETLINQIGGDTEQAIVAPSTLVSTASLLVPLGPAGVDTTAIAISNPSLGTGGVNLVLTDQDGGQVLNTVVRLGPRGHFSKFLNELGSIPPLDFSTPFLLTISAEIPVAVLALHFRNGDFAPIPLTSLSFPTPVPVQPLTPPTTTSSSPGFGLGVPSTTNPPPRSFVPATVTNSPIPTTTSIGGGTSLVFAEVATGGGWSTDIAIGNTSSGFQTVRIDFFGANGVNISSITNIQIPPRGVFVVSTESVTALR